MAWSGVFGDGVFQNVDDPNDATVYQDLETIDAARTFIDYLLANDIMKKSRAVGDAEIWFTG